MLIKTDQNRATQSRTDQNRAKQRKTGADQLILQDLAKQGEKKQKQPTRVTNTGT
jgi:hypothetical protein